MAVASTPKIGGHRAETHIKRRSPRVRVGATVPSVAGWCPGPAPARGSCYGVGEQSADGSAQRRPVDRGDTMRVMIVGTGAIAFRHAAAARNLDGADLIAVCDVRREAADALGDRFGVESRYTDLGAMLRSEQADLAIIA